MRLEALIPLAAVNGHPLSGLSVLHEGTLCTFHYHGSPCADVSCCIP